jgi:protease-4
MAYRMFLRRIQAGRGMDPERAHQIGQGRVWSGDAALREGLVDHLGGFGAALARARSLGRLPADAEVIVRPNRPSGLLDYVLSGSGGRSDVSASEMADPPSPLAAVPAELRAVTEVAAALSHVRRGAPVARLPWVVLTP